jgi:hypothetical protein
VKVNVSKTIWRLAGLVAALFFGALGGSQDRALASGFSSGIIAYQSEGIIGGVSQDVIHLRALPNVSDRIVNPNTLRFMGSNRIFYRSDVQPWASSLVEKRTVDCSECSGWGAGANVISIFSPATDKGVT